MSAEVQRTEPEKNMINKDAAQRGELRGEDVFNGGDSSTSSVDSRVTGNNEEGGLQVDSGNGSVTATTPVAYGNSNNDDPNALIKGNTKAVHRYVRTKEQRKLAKGGKAGHPGRFQGDMLEFLQSKLPEYQRLPSAGHPNRCAMLSTFWDSVIDLGFWKKFSFESVRATFREESLMSDEEVIAATTSSIKSWYRRKTTDNRSSALASAMAGSLKELRKPADGQPKKLLGWQLFMSKNAAIVDEHLQHKKTLPENKGRADIALRTMIAKRLLQEADEAVKSSIEQAVEEDFNRKLDLKNHLEVAEESDPIVQANARQMLARVVIPLLKTISTHTGLENITLLCGSAPKDAASNYVVSAVHCGKTKEAVPRNFFEFDEEEFRLHVLPPFCRFLTATTENGLINPTAGLPPNLDLSLTMPEEEEGDDDEELATPKIVVKAPDEPEEGKDVSTPTISAAPTPKRIQPKRTPRTATPTAVVDKGNEKREEPKLRLRPGACIELVRKIEAMEGITREKEIERLNALPENEFGWVNSHVKVSALVGSDPEPELERFSLPPPPTVVPPSVDVEVVPELPTTVDANQPSQTIAGAATPDPNPDQPADTIPISHVDSSSPPTNLPDNLPPWIKQHADRLLDIPMVEELKVRWKSIIHNWVNIEKALGFATPRDGFTPAGRPAAISLWVQNARRKSVVIQPNAGLQFTEEWFEWWSSINPEWRQRTSGRLVVGGEGDWACMFKPGKCGFLLVLECLVGLREVAPVEDLTEVMADVGWVVECVLEALKTSAADEPGSETAGLDSACKPSAKRKRTGRNTSPHTEDSDKEETSKDDTPVVSKKARKVGQRRSARR